MKVHHILEDLKRAFEMNEDFKSFSVGFAEYTEDRDGTIYLKDVEAIDWDEDEEFFLIPFGIAKHYELQAKSYTAIALFEELVSLPDIHEFDVFARSKTKVAKDGSVASINSPTWATNYLTKDKIIYFQHGDSLDS